MKTKQMALMLLAALIVTSANVRAAETNATTATGTTAATGTTGTAGTRAGSTRTRRAGARCLRARDVARARALAHALLG